MATLLDDRSTVGLWPLPGTAKRADLLTGIATPGVGSFELRPLAFENMSEALANGDISSLDDYVAPYQTFSLPITAIPSLPNETIVSISLEPIPPIPTTTPFKAIVEEPNPASAALRTGVEDPQLVSDSILWEPPLVNEDYIIQTGGSSLDGGLTAVATISGYYTEKAFYDREWILRFPDVVAKISGAGIRYLLYEQIPSGVPFDPKLFDTNGLTYPSPITLQTWHAATKADAEILDAPAMQQYLSTCSGIVSYKASEIKKLRFFYICYINSTTPAPLTGLPVPQQTIIPCFMTVQNNASWAQKRLTYALNTPKAPKPLLGV